MTNPDGEWRTFVMCLRKAEGIEPSGLSFNSKVFSFAKSAGTISNKLLLAMNVFREGRNARIVGGSKYNLLKEISKYSWKKLIVNKIKCRTSLLKAVIASGNIFNLLWDIFNILRLISNCKFVGVLVSLLLATFRLVMSRKLLQSKFLILCRSTENKITTGACVVMLLRL